METKGIIRRSKSPWSSPLHIVKKPNSEYRPCGAYVQLNNKRVEDRYPVPQAIPMKDITTTSCCKALLTWISHFGLPLNITSDGGRQFISQLWNELAINLGIHTKNTTYFHPQCNGIIERFHRQLKASLKAKLNNSNWVDELPLILLGIRSVPKEDLGCSSSELVNGTTLRLPGQFFESTPTSTIETDVFLSRIKNSMTKIRATPTSFHGNNKGHTISETLKKTNYVF